MWNCNLCHVLPQVPKYIGLVNVPKKEIAYILQRPLLEQEKKFSVIILHTYCLSGGAIAPPLY